MKIRTFLGGSVRVRATCAVPERMVSRLLSAKVPLREIAPDGETGVSFLMHAVHVPQLPKLLRGLHVRIRLGNRLGAGRHVARYLRRPFFLLGAAVALATVLLATSFVWNVRIIANGADDCAMLDHLATLGLSPGVYSKSLNFEQLKEQLINRMPNLVWVGLYRDGATVTVDYRLREMAPEIIPRELPVNIYASRPGVLTGLHTYQGTKIAKEGDTVKAGQLLVSAQVPIGTDRTVLVHALAAAQARTWYDVEAVSPSFGLEKQGNGKEITIMYLETKNYRINLSPGTGKMTDDYGIIKGDYTLSVSTRSLGFLPVQIVTERYTFFDLSETDLDAADTQRYMEHALTQTLLEGMKDGNVTESNFTLTQQDGVYSLRGSYECTEDIGVTGIYQP